MIYKSSILEGIMNLDELVESILNISNEKVVQDFTNYIKSFKNENRHISEWGCYIEKYIEKYIGNIWIEKTEDHNKIYKLWDDYRKLVMKNLNK
jgi:hypothetical protein